MGVIIEVLALLFLATKQVAPQYRQNLEAVKKKEKKKITYTPSPALRCEEAFWSVGPCVSHMHRTLGRFFTFHGPPEKAIRSVDVNCSVSNDRVYNYQLPKFRDALSTHGR